MGEGALGFSILWIWPTFGWVFLVFTLKKLRFICSGVLRCLRVFPNLVFGFRFLSTMKAVFLVLPKKLRPAVEHVILRHHLYSVLRFLLEEWMTSLVCLADFEKLEITQKTIYQIPRGWDKIV